MRPATSAAFDPFLALAPVLVGVAVALITIRLYPYPVRAIGWLAARRRDLVAVLGLRTIGRDPAAAYLPLLVLMLTVAIGSFTSVVRVTVDRGQVDDSWRQVGADYRIENGNGGTLAPRSTRRPSRASVPSRRATARRRSRSTLAGRSCREHVAPRRSSPPRSRPSSRAARSTARCRPASRSAPTGATAGTADDPIPAVVSSHPPTGAASRPRSATSSR